MRRPVKLTDETQQNSIPAYGAHGGFHNTPSPVSNLQNMLHVYGVEYFENGASSPSLSCTQNQGI